MGTKTVEVEVDIDEFDTDDLVDELLYRVNSMGRKKLTDAQKKQLLEAIEPLFEELSPSVDLGIEIKTIEDEMKRDHIAKVWNKYTSYQLEQIIP